MAILKIQKQLLRLGLKVFSRAEFQRLCGLSPVAAKKALERYTEAGLFLRPRRDFYLFPMARPSQWLISNKLYRPSYVSYETALSHYGLIPETVYAVTAATARRPGGVEVMGTAYVYHHIGRHVFTGYRPVEIEGSTIFLASPEKALCDFLHLVFLRKKALNERTAWNRVDKAGLLSWTGLYRPKSFSRWVRNVIR